jgi:hypothetical protein
VTAGRDVLVDATASTTGALTASRDIALRARSGAAAIASASAGDDVAILAPAGAVTVTGVLVSGTAPVSDALGVADALLAVGESGPTTIAGVTFDLTGSDVDVRAGTTINVGAATTAEGRPGTAPVGSDARFVAGGAVTLAAVTAERDVLVDGSTSADGAVAIGAVSAGRDVGLRANRGALNLTSGSAGDDLVLRARDAIAVSGALTTGGFAGATTEQAADGMFAQNQTVLNGAFSITDGAHVDVRNTGGGITVGGATTAAGDARFQAAGAVQVAAVTAGRDVFADGTTASTGALVGTRDVAVRARTGALSAASASAGDDVALRALGGSVTVAGELRSGTAPSAAAEDATGAANRLVASGESGAITIAGVTGDLTGHDVDVRAGTTINIAGATTAEGRPGTAPFGSDARYQAGGAVTLAAVTAERDALVDGSTTVDGAVTTGALSAGRDIGVRAGRGSLTVASASAGDDVILRARDSLTASGTLTASNTGSAGTAEETADAIAAADPIRGQGDLAFLHTGGADVSVKAGGNVTLNGVSAQRDILVDTGAVAGFNGATNSSAGNLFAIVRDVQFAGTVNVAEDVILYSRAANVQVGGSAADAGTLFNLSSAEINGITADSVNVFGGLPTGGSAPITVGNVTLSGQMAAMRVYTTGDITISGTILGNANSVFVAGAAATQYSTPTPGIGGDAPVFEVGTRSWNLSTGWTPGTIRLTGVIGGPANTDGDTLGAGDAWLGLVSLAANRVLIFPSEDTALLSVGGFEEATGGPDGDDPARLFAYSGNLDHQIVADTLAIRASDEILQRNLDTAVPGSTDGRGLVAGRLLVDTLTDGGTVPTRLSLFGQLASDLNGLHAGVTLVDGPGAATLVRDEGAGASASVRFNAPPGTYRFNGCEIGTGGGCLTVRVDPTLPPIDAISSIGNLLDRFATIEDEPVTNPGIELFWFARPDDEDEDEDAEEEEKK